MVEAFVGLATKYCCIPYLNLSSYIYFRCIAPFLLSDQTGESFIKLSDKDILLLDCLRTRLNTIMEERAGVELKLQSETSSTIPSTMQWSAKIHNILPGKEIRIPIPSLPEDATLEWSACYIPSFLL